MSVSETEYKQEMEMNNKRISKNMLKFTIQKSNMPSVEMHSIPRKQSTVLYGCCAKSSIELLPQQVFHWKTNENDAK